MAGPRKQYAFRPAPELDGRRGHYPVVIAGAGPVGMAAARDLALRGIRSIVLDDDDKVSVGSRAICWATPHARDLRAAGHRLAHDAERGHLEHRSSVQWR